MGAEKKDSTNQRSRKKARMTPADIGVTVSEGSPQQLFRWFLASFLFGRPIQQSVAAKTYKALITHGLTSAKKFDGVDREPLRVMLDEGGYARLDYQTADRLHAAMGAIVRDYGSVNRLVKSARNRPDLAKTVQKLQGVGPTTARIFVGPIPPKIMTGRA